MAPKIPESATMLGRVRVHCRAAAGGVTTKATMRTRPTAFTPMTVAITIVVNMSVSIARALKPSTVEWSGSKVRSVNSLKNTIIKRSANAPTAILVHRSATVITDAFPNR